MIYLATKIKIGWEHTPFERLKDAIKAVANNSDYPQKPYKILKELEVSTDIKMAREQHEHKTSIKEMG